MSIALENVYKPSDDVVAREIEGEIIIVPLVAGTGDMEELFTLNDTGKAIWDQLDGQRSLRVWWLRSSPEFEEAEAGAAATSDLRAAKQRRLLAPLNRGIIGWKEGEAGRIMVETTQSIAVADLAAEAVRRLRASLQVERIYLFGSRARDEADEDSDYDFLVVVRDSPLPRYKREQQAFRALCGMGIPKDVLVLTREEFERGLAVVSSLPATVAREGRLLYGG